MFPFSCSYEHSVHMRAGSASVQLSHIQGFNCSLIQSPAAVPACVTVLAQLDPVF